MNCKEVEEKIYGYNRQLGDTGTNLVANRINEVSDALGFNSTLLKENCNPSKPFFFQKNDIELLIKFMDITKSKEGKRLRCRDYKGAGIECIKETSRILTSLAEHNGVPQMWVDMSKLKIEEFTNHFCLREHIRAESNDLALDLDEHFFAPIASCQDNDSMDEVDRLIFLEFLEQNITRPPLELRGIYWFYVMKKKHTEQMSIIKGAENVYKAYKRSQQTYEEIKDYAVRRVKLAQSLSNDLELDSLIKEQNYYYDGNGKLKDNKKVKQNEKKINSIISSHVKNAYECDIVSDVNNTVNNEKYYNEENRKYLSRKNMLKKAVKEYFRWKNKQYPNPFPDNDKPSFMISFRERFGVSIFDIE